MDSREDVKELRERMKDVIDEYCERNFTEDNIRLWCEAGGMPHGVTQDFYDSELAGFALPIAAGGLDCPFIDRVSLIARMTRRAGATLPLLTDMMAYALLTTMRSLSQEEITQEILPIEGRVVFSQAFTEPGAGTDAQAIQTTVSVEGDSIFLDGEKTFVSAGQFLSQTLVLTRDPIFGQRDGGMSLWLIPTNLPGVSIYPIRTIGQEMNCPARLVFDHVELNPEWQIQTEGILDHMLKRQYSLGRVLICATSLGLATAAMDDALAAVSARKVKGMPLHTLPQIQEKIVEMAVKIEAMRKLVTKAALSADGSAEDFALNCALMKYYVPRAATEVASDAMQIMGGVGYTDESRVSRIWRDCRGNQIAQGTDEVMVHVASKLLVRKAGDLYPDIFD